VERFIERINAVAVVAARRAAAFGDRSVARRFRAERLA
jgi:hypothetical protein